MKLFVLFFYTTRNYQVFDFQLSPKQSLFEENTHHLANSFLINSVFTKQKTVYTYTNEPDNSSSTNKPTKINC